MNGHDLLGDHLLVDDGITVNRGGAEKLIGMLFHLFREAADWGGIVWTRQKRERKKKRGGRRRTENVSCYGRSVDTIPSSISSHS